MYHYELLCLDSERTRSIWLTHPREYSTTELSAQLAQTQLAISPDTLREWADETRSLHDSTLELGISLGLSPELRGRLESRMQQPDTTLSAVLDRLVDRFCHDHGFERLIPTAVVVRHGQEVVVT